MNEKFGRCLIVVGAVLILCALVFYLRNQTLDRRAGAQARKTLEQLRTVVENEIVKTDTRPVMPEEQSENSEGKPERRTNMPTVYIDDVEYIGYMSIPVIEIELPVAAELNEDTLASYPCRYVGSAYTNNLVIAAHNFVSSFGELKTLKTGDEVELTDINGNVFRYKVELMEKLLPASVDEMINSEYDFTLFTCTKGGKFRIAVRCNEIEKNYYKS